MATSLTRTKSRGSDFELTYASPTVVKRQGADEESLERHSRKRHRPRAYSDESGNLNRDGRRRRNRGSSDDEGKITFDGFTNEDLRVGGPYLCSIPTETFAFPESHSLFERLMGSRSRPIHDQVYTILAKHEIRPRMVNFVGRKSRFNPEASPTPTALVYANRETVDRKWLEAAKDIHSYLVAHDIQNVSVEIADPEVFNPPKMFPVLKTDSIFSFWDSFLKTMLEELDLTGMKMVGCYRRGRSQEIMDNPPTVLVIVDTTSIRDWKPTRELIVGILDRYNLSMVAVEISKDEEWMGTGWTKNTGLSRAVLRGPAIIGESLALAQDNKRSGSLGGFLELKNPVRGDWVQFAITCFHCVIPSKEDLESKDIDATYRSQMMAWIRNGVRADDPVAKLYLQVNHPSGRGIDEELEKLQDRIKSVEDEPLYQKGALLEPDGLLTELSEIGQNNYHLLKEEIAASRSFQQDIWDFRDHPEQILGHVAAASGYKVIRSQLVQDQKTVQDDPDLTNMDWALIRVRDDRKGSNSVDGLGFLSTPETRIDLHGRGIFMKGYRSGKSEGVFNGLRVARIATVLNDKDEEVKVPTLEHQIMGIEGKPFALRGDSGSFVFTRGGGVLGLMFGGLEFDHIAYFTHVEDLFNDIRAVTGATEVRFS
ncbi:hypothetical protein NUU61_005348 [Penicillium alfredii]|uniref:Uncharacterized protein n=1 Tax=Penicillium alfredii TaxID=1506179 RepID=A0A9W9F9M8_9EURO|nr:uncharacterized protein NUU61_005348 [Penicillium alfredii]KAJ5095992.1 hypothetical protein NUU61_005348 [Penicillium alfredii]